MTKVCKILCLGGLLLLPSCLSWFWEQPIFVPRELAVARFSLTEIHFLFGVEVQNPNRFDLKLRGLEYTLYLNDREVGKGRIDNEVKIAKASSTLVQVPLQANFKGLGDPLALFFGGKDLSYKIEGVAIISASLGTATYPFSKSGEIKIKK